LSSEQANEWLVTLSSAMLFLPSLDSRDERTAKEGKRPNEASWTMHLPMILPDKKISREILPAIA